jgi:hypothetical protein
MGLSDERPLFIANDEILIRLSPDGREVWVRLGTPHSSLGMGRDIVLAMSLSPEEAHRLADALVRTAREAQERSSPH